MGDREHFIFNKIDTGFFEEMCKKAYVFNVSRERVKQIKIPVNFIDTGESGIINQKVDLFILGGGEIEGVSSTLLDGEVYINVEGLINLERCFEVVTPVGGGYYDLYRVMDRLEKLDLNFNIRGLLVITRTVSNYIGDKIPFSSRSEFYYFCPDYVSEILELNSALLGMLASNRKRVNSVKDIVEHLKEVVSIGRLDEYNYREYLSLLNIKEMIQ